MMLARTTRDAARTRNTRLLHDDRALADGLPIATGRVPTRLSTGISS